MRAEPVRARPIVVVSSDREVAETVRAMGARAVGSPALLRRLVPRLTTASTAWAAPDVLYCSGMSTDRGNGLVRRAGLFMGLVSDKRQPASTYVRGELTRFQLKMIGFYVAAVAGGLWISWVGQRPTARMLELAVLLDSCLVPLDVRWTAVRRARSHPPPPSPPENVGGSS